MNDVDDLLFNRKAQMAVKKIKEVDTPEPVKPENVKYGVGLDVGTGWLVGSSMTENGIQHTPLRDCFYSIDSEMFSKSMFNRNTIKYVEHNGMTHIVGEDALTLSKIQNGAALRPLAKGVINPDERSAAPILKEMIKYCVDKYKKKENEKLVFSVPAKLIGSPDAFNVEYHSLSIASLVKSLGFDPVPLNEAYAVIIAELDKAVEVTGLGISFGAGLVNVAFAYKGMSIFEFSINKSGDFIDQESAKACGVAESIINHIKEKKLDLTKDEYTVSPEERALIFTHKHVIKNTVENIVKAFSQSGSINILEPVPVVVSGGTSLPNGFIEIFTEELNKVKKPFDVEKVIPATDRLVSVAKGCLLWSNMLEGNNKD